MLVLSHTANPSLGKIIMSLADFKAISLLFPLHHAQTNWAHFFSENPVMEGFFPPFVSSALVVPASSNNSGGLNGEKQVRYRAEHDLIGRACSTYYF